MRQLLGGLNFKVGVIAVAAAAVVGGAAGAAYTSLGHPNGPVHVRSADVVVSPSDSPSPDVSPTDSPTPTPTPSPVASPSSAPPPPPATQAPAPAPAPSPVAPSSYCGYAYEAGHMPLQPGPSSPVYETCQAAIDGGAQVGTAGGNAQVVGLIRTPQGNLYLLASGDWLPSWKITKN